MNCLSLSWRCAALVLVSCVTGLARRKRRRPRPFRKCGTPGARAVTARTAPARSPSRPSRSSRWTSRNCSLTTPEGDPDWEAVISKGGPVTGLVVADAGVRRLSHAGAGDGVRRVHQEASARRRAGRPGNLNLPRPMFAEKAFLEDEFILAPVASHRKDEPNGVRAGRDLREANRQARPARSRVFPSGSLDAGSGPEFRRRRHRARVEVRAESDDLESPSSPRASISSCRPAMRRRALAAGMFGLRAVHLRPRPTSARRATCRRSSRLEMPSENHLAGPGRPLQHLLRSRRQAAAVDVHVRGRAQRRERRSGADAAAPQGTVEVRRACRCVRRAHSD